MAKQELSIKAWEIYWEVLLEKNIRHWNLLVTQAEFAYNRSGSQTISCSPFEIVYGQNPINLLELAPLPNTQQFNREAKEKVKFVKKTTWISLRSHYPSNWEVQESSQQVLKNSSF